jgi:hypothetical protein
MKGSFKAETPLVACKKDHSSSELISNSQEIAGADRSLLLQHEHYGSGSGSFAYRPSAQAIHDSGSAICKSNRTRRAQHRWDGVTHRRPGHADSMLPMAMRPLI